jgi:hypothetical protein
VNAVLSLPQNHKNAVPLLVAEGANVVLGPAEAINSHQGSAAFRRQTRVLVAQLVLSEWRRRELTPDKARLCVLYHTESELSAYQRILVAPEGASTQKAIKGWRDVQRGQDAVRGRQVYLSGLKKTSAVFVMSDASYYFTTEEFVDLMEGHDLLKAPECKGVTVFVVSRFLPDKEKSLMVERFRAPGCSLPDGVAPKRRPRPSAEDSLESDEEDKPAEMVFDDVDTVEAVAEFRNGEIHFHASTSSSDSFYQHKVSNDLLTRPRVTVKVGTRHLECQSHVERHCGPYAVVRVLLRCVAADRVQADAPKREWAMPHSFLCYDGKLVGGTMTTLLHSFRTDLEQSSSVSSSVASALRRTLFQLPESQRKCLDKYDSLLVACARTSLENAVALSRGAAILALPHMPGAQATVDHQVAQRLVASSGVSLSVGASVARLTRKQTHVQFIAELFGAIAELAGFLWDRIKSWALSLLEGFKTNVCTESTPLMEPLSVLGATVRLSLFALRKLKAFTSRAQGIMNRIGKLGVTASYLKWMHEHPRAAVILEEMGHVAVCVITAAAEECLKKAGGFHLAAIFGAIESIIVVAHELLSGVGGSKSELALVVTKAILRVAAHVILWLAPLWVSVPLHALFNYIVTKGSRRRMFQGLYDKLAAYQFDFAMFDQPVEPLAASMPSEKWAEKAECLFVREPDGELIPLADLSPLINFEGGVPKVTRVPRLINPITHLFSKPVGDLKTVCLVAALRLDAVPAFKPQHGMWRATTDEFTEMLAAIDDRGFQMMTVEETVAYFEDRPWTNAHKKMRISQFLAATAGSRKAEKALSVKTDEILVVRDALGDENASDVNKSRPLCPVDEVGVLATQWVVPCKRWLGRRWYWSFLDGEWIATTHPVGDMCFVFVYVLETRADLITATVRELLRECCVVWLAHGDDMVGFWMNDDGLILSFVFDFETCDLSCGKSYQKAFKRIVEFATSGEAEEWLELFMEAKTGLFRVVTAETEINGIDVFYKKDDVTTITGEMATSLLAVGGQLFPIPRVLRLMGSNISQLPNIVCKVFNACGFNPKFEIDPDDGTFWRDPEAVTFLGGAFVISDDGDASWYSLGLVKQAFLGHSTLPVTHAAQRYDAAVCVSMPDILATPCGRAFRRMLIHVWQLDPIFIAESLAAWKVDLMHTNRFLAETGVDYVAPRISRRDYFRGMQKLCASAGYPDPQVDLEQFCAECDAGIVFGSIGETPVISTNLLPFYVARFGKPASAAGGDDSFEMMPLCLIKNAYDLGGEIFAKCKNTTQQQSSFHGMPGKDKSTDKKGRKARTAVRRPANAALAAAAKVPNRLPKALGNQLRSLSDPLTRQDEAIFGYLNTVADPFITVPCGVPLILGSGGVITEKAAIPRTFTVKANAAGFGFLTMNADGWIAEATYQYASYSGGSQGSNVWYTDGVAAYAGVALPAVAATTATVGLVSSATTLVDGSWVANTNLRMIGMGLQVWSDDAELTTKGDIYVISTSEPYGAAAQGALPGTTEAILTGLNAAIVSLETRPLAGWVSGQVMSTAAIPSDAQCFKFVQPVAVGNQTFGYPQIGVMMTGCASGQTLKVKTIVLYEYEKTQTNRVGDVAEPTLSAPESDISGGLNHLSKLGASNGYAAPHVPSGIHGGKGTQAFVNHLTDSRPLKVPSLVAEMKNPSMDWGATAKHALSWGAKKAASFLPSWASGIANNLIGTFLG